MNRPAIPDDFPRRPPLGAIAGTQSKILVRRIGDQLTCGPTEHELRARYEMCEDLARLVDVLYPAQNDGKPCVVAKGDTFEDQRWHYSQSPEWTMGSVLRRTCLAARTCSAVDGMRRRKLRMLNGEENRRQETMRRIFARGNWLTADQINALQAKPSTNGEQCACDWKRRRLIFSLSVNGREHFAGYQFDAMCQPLPVIKEILNVLGPITDPWKIAAWFYFPNGWISGDGEHKNRSVAPMDALERRETVVNAARYMRETTHPPSQPRNKIDLEIALRKVHELAMSDGDIGYAYWYAVGRLLRRATDMQSEINVLKKELERYRSKSSKVD